MRSDLVSKGADGFGIEDVASQRLRHFEMVADEPPHLIAFFQIEFQASEQTICQLHALYGVVAGAAGLSGVMHQQCEEEQIETVDFFKQSGKASFPGGLRLAEGVHIVDDEEGMFVDGITVVGVADDQRVDAMEFGNEQLENAQGMHGTQRVRSVRSQQNLAQAVPQKRTFWYVHVEHRQGIGQAVFRMLGQAIAMRRDQSEHAQDSLGPG